MSVRRRVVVTGFGVVSAAGIGSREFFDALLQGRSGVAPLPWRPDIVAAQVPWREEEHFSRAEAGALDRGAQFAFVAAGEALQRAGLDRQALPATRTGLYLGTGMGGATALDRGYTALLAGDGRVSPSTVVLSMANAPASHLAMRLGIRGPTLTYSIACASAAVAIGEACAAIRSGVVDVAIAGGCEALLVPGVVAAWHAMRVMAAADADDPARSCRPFSAGRSGLVLGEGAGIVVLEEEGRASRRGAPLLAEIAGYGLSNDATHIAKPDSEGQAEAMRAALADAGLRPESIGYLNAHGTGTAVGDVVETRSIRAAFGASAAGLPVSSTKALHGHLLGASGAVELVAALMSLGESLVPPTANFTAPDPQCDLDYVTEGPRPLRSRAVMSNSFAFGGTNAVLIAADPAA